MPKAHPLNVSGPWYVEDGCCTMCSVPLDHAPDLFSYTGDADGASHCYVVRQPRTFDETTRMVEVTRNAEFACIRYRGRDQGVLAALDALGLGDRVDVRPDRE